MVEPRGLGRIDVTGALALREALERAATADIEAEVDVPKLTAAERRPIG